MLSVLCVYMRVNEFSVFTLVFIVVKITSKNSLVMYLLSLPYPSVICMISFMLILLTWRLSIFTFISLLCLRYLPAFVQGIFSYTILHGGVKVALFLLAGMPSLSSTHLLASTPSLAGMPSSIIRYT